MRVPAPVEGDAVSVIAQRFVKIRGQFLLVMPHLIDAVSQRLACDDGLEAAARGEVEVVSTASWGGKLLSLRLAVDLREDLGAPDHAES